MTTLSVKFSLPDFISADSRKLNFYGFTVYFPDHEPPDQIREPFEGLAILTANISRLVLGVHTVNSFVEYPGGIVASESINKSINRRMFYDTSCFCKILCYFLFFLVTFF